MADSWIPSVSPSWLSGYADWAIFERAQCGDMGRAAGETFPLSLQLVLAEPIETFLKVFYRGEPPKPLAAMPDPRQTSPGQGDPRVPPKGDGTGPKPTGQEDPPPPIRVPALYLDRPQDLRDAKLSYSVVVTEEFFRILGENAEAAAMVRRIILGATLPPDARSGGAAVEAAQTPEPGKHDPAEHAVVVGIIDDGIGFAATRFRHDVTSSRVEYFWAQDGRFRPGSTVPYGRELDRAEIDGLLAASMVGGMVDEDQVYRRATTGDFGRGVRKGITRSLSHGTHVMDLASGYPMEDGRTDRPIVAVQLPARSVGDTSGLSLEPHVLLALHYILDRARLVAESRKLASLPVVINFSFGLAAGPHDGTHLLEEAFEEVLDGRKDRRIVLPAGNTRQRRLHARMHPKKGKSESLTWRVLPDDFTPSFIEVWMPCGMIPKGGRVGLTLIPPGGPASPELVEEEGAGFSWQLPDRNGIPVTVAKLGYHAPPPAPAPASRSHFFIAIAPTMAFSRACPLAPSGNWTIVLRNIALGRGETVKFWVQRDESPLGFPVRGRQSHFTEPDYVLFDPVSGRLVDRDSPGTVIRRNRTQNAIASGPGTMVAGAYTGRSGGPAFYSAGGPLSAPCDGSRPARIGPDALAIGDSSPVLAGILASGSRSGARRAMPGSSVAAPQVTRWLADQLALGSSPQHGEVQQEATNSGIPGPVMPRPRAGGGRFPHTPLYPSSTLRSR